MACVSDIVSSDCHCASLMMRLPAVCVPSTSACRPSAQALVENGETAIIAGLIRKVESKLDSGIPILQDIPLLGALFRHETTADVSRELVIFVTPRIVTREYLNRDLMTPASNVTIEGATETVRSGGPNFNEF